MKYRPGIDKLMNRMQSFYDSDSGGALIQIGRIEELMQHMHSDLTQWDYSTQMCEYLDGNLAMSKIYWQERLALYDDMIPAIRPWYGIGELSAFVGGDVSFSESTSWHHPIIHEWSDLENLELREDNLWFRRVIDGLTYLKSKSEGQFAIMLRGADGPMDLANALRGNDFFMDMALDPINTHKLLDFCTQASSWFLSQQQKAVGQFYGGYITGYDIWVPGNATGHVGEDVTAMCSDEMFKKTGRSYMERLSEDFDFLMVHTHSVAMHNIPHVASIPRVKILEITDDPNALKGIEVYKKLAQKLQDVIVVVRITKKDLLDNLEFLRDKKTILKYHAQTLKESQEIVSIVRNELSWD